MNDVNQFDWVEFYKELSSELLQYKNNRKALVEKVFKIYEVTDISLPTLEKDNQIVDIDPFTFFGLFNKKLTDANRLTKFPFCDFVLFVGKKTLIKRELFERYINRATEV